jgi:serine/threonine protein kinase
VWPELTPESAGYAFTRDICQVATGSVKLAEKKRTGSFSSFQVVKCFEKAKVQKDAEDQMREEVELMFTLGAHKNIGKALEVFQDSLSYYVVQPFYAGGNLVNLKARAVGAGVVTIEEWWMSIATQCLEALAHMHAQGVMHCDIKEQNIMLQGEDLWEPEVVIIDLGVAQRSSTQRSIIYGTPGYIPPEVWEAKNWHPESDMFSLGVVVLQMLIGRTGIFTDDTTTFKDVAEATRSRSPPFDAIPSEYPRLKWLAQKLLVKEFRSRPSAACVLQEPWEDVQAVLPKSQRRHTMPGLQIQIDTRSSEGHNERSDLIQSPSAAFLRGPPRKNSEVDSPIVPMRRPGQRPSPVPAQHARLGFPMTPRTGLGHHGGVTPTTPGCNARPNVAGFTPTLNSRRRTSLP